MDTKRDTQRLTSMDRAEYQTAEELRCRTRQQVSDVASMQTMQPSKHLGYKSMALRNRKCILLINKDPYLSVRMTDELSAEITSQTRLYQRY